MFRRIFTDSATPASLGAARCVCVCKAAFSEKYSARKRKVFSVGYIETPLAVGRGS